MACLPAFAPGLAFQAQAQGDRALEYQVKAAFLYNFVKFVDWPPEVWMPNTPITIGILGDDPFGDKLDAMIKGKSIDGRELVIKRHLEGPQEWNACHVLFISASEKKRLPQILETTRKKSILTVSEVERFTKMGGIINFLMVNDKVAFEISREAAEEARLKISSKLLRLAVGEKEHK